MAGAIEGGTVEVKKQASRGLVKETSWERKEDAAAWQEKWPWRSTHRLSCHGQRSQTFRSIRIHSSVGPI